MKTRIISAIVVAVLLICGIYDTKVGNVKADEITNKNKEAVSQTNVNVEKTKIEYEEENVTEYYIQNVQNISQNPELPAGCEITCGCILLHHYGYDIDKVNLSDNYLKQTETFYGANPDVEFMGNPKIAKGWNCGFYCWQQPVIDALNTYLNEQKSSYQAIDISGITINQLKEYIKDDKPVAVWVTIGFCEPGVNTEFTWEINGKQFSPNVNMHCLVVTGFDNDNYYLADPLNLNESISVDRFEYVWNLFGNRAIVLEKL